jgi:hypothetical protein
MKDTLRERGKSHEAKYKLDEELKFKAVARRNKLIGLWAAERLGLNAPKAVTYAKEVVGAGLASADGVVDKMAKDFHDRGIEIGAEEIRGEMTRLLAVARDQVANEYPQPLGPDHARVGDWPA